jgi:hypothetical protein
MNNWIYGAEIIKNILTGLEGAGIPLQIEKIIRCADFIPPQFAKISEIISISKHH